MLDYEEVKKDSQRIAKIKHFMNKHNWEGINLSSEKDDLNNLRKNVTIAPYSFLCQKIYILPAYVSKYNSNWGKMLLF